MLLLKDGIVDREAEDNGGGCEDFFMVMTGSDSRHCRDSVKRRVFRLRQVLQ
jgi:hypothetical protein